MRGLWLALALGACGQAEYADEAASVEVYSPAPPPPGTTSTATTDSATAPPAVQARTTPPPPSPGAQPALAPPAATPPGAAAPLLAYSYQYALEAPTAGARALLRRHEEACLAAGPTICQVIGSNTQQMGGSEFSAQLTFRAAPAYVTRFRAGLAREVQGARGEVSSSRVETEDLTRSIIDTEARLRAGRLLRTRLEQLIASRPGNLQQLLEIERELARVGGEIDAAESTLAVMRARVAMSSVTVTYASGGAVVDPGDSRPLAEAGDSFARNLASSSAVILTFLSLVLPWAVILGLAGWGLAALARHHRRRAAKPTPTPPVDFGSSNSPP